MTVIICQECGKKEERPIRTGKAKYCLHCAEEKILDRQDPGRRDPLPPNRPGYEAMIMCYLKDPIRPSSVYEPASRLVFSHSHRRQDR
jgi:hypothetical protein